MKKTLAFFVCFVMLFTIGCSQKGETSSNSTTDTSSVITSSEETSTSIENVTSSGSEDKPSNSEPTSSKNTASSKPQASSSVETTSSKVTNTSSTQTPQRPTIKIITCYGDSVTEGMGMPKDLTYPYQLGEMLGNGYRVQNCGDGGERTTDIMARQGGMRIFTKEDFTFAAGVKKIKIDTGPSRGFIAEDGRGLRWTAPFGRDVKISQVTINGASYTLTIENYTDSAHCDTYLSRTGYNLKEITIPKGSEAILATTETSKSNYCDIYLMGFNGNYNDVDELVAQYKKMVDYRNDENYLIVIPYMSWDKKTYIENYEKFKAAFGDHAIDLVGYAADGGMGKAGLTITDVDKKNLDEGFLPISLRNAAVKGDVHLNGEGYKLLATALYEQGKKINLW